MIDRRMIKNQAKQLLMGFWKLVAGLALVLFLLTHRGPEQQQAEAPVPTIDPDAEELE